MEPAKLREIVSAVKADPRGIDGEAVAAGVSIDTRTLLPGDVFFALSGNRADGSRYVAEAFRRGAAAAVVDAGADLSGQDLPAARVLRVADAARALWDWADRYRSGFDLPVVAVTGSCGKTTTRELLHAILSPGLGEGHRSRASHNNAIGVPLTLLGIGRRHAFAVAELGANHLGEIRPLARLVRPRVGVITNVRSVHLEGFGDLFGVARTKGELFEELPRDGVAVFNPAELGLSLIARRCALASVTFGARPGVHVRLESAEEGPGGIAARINGVRFEVPLMSRRLAWNVCAAAAAGLAFGIDLPRASEALRGFEAPSDRLSRRVLGGLLMLYDAYNANLSSMRAALEAVRAQAQGRRKVLVLGDMLELGNASRGVHEALGRAAAGVEPDLTVS
ncbi:MAG: UDP-N-acetylmuramoyl-tripeptide--D-alanyl-D-alanine ligase, partial [Planctomycetes bacterium]|nr:UDP-N-acetylmuramoyl-tripeptide--D-alanyl-D-alanine ligase [Planctomycetota bacterium]